MRGATVTAPRRAELQHGRSVELIDVRPRRFTRLIGFVYHHTFPISIGVAMTIPQACGVVAIKQCNAAHAEKIWRRVSSSGAAISAMRYCAAKGATTRQICRTAPRKRTG